MKNMKSPLSRARGLGSAKSGVQHWWMQRVTAVALAPLVLWLAFAVASLPGGDYATAVHWLRQPWVAVAMALFLVALFQHSQLGLQVVIEDYVGNEAAKLTALLAMKFAHALLAVASVLAVLKIALGGA